jgi:hypothetical protein
VKTGLATKGERGLCGYIQACPAAQDVDDDVQALHDAIQQRLGVVSGVLVAQVIVGPGDNDLPRKGVMTHEGGGRTRDSSASVWPHESLSSP